MKAKGRWLAIATCIALTACAATGTRVTSSTDGYKSMARSQQWWCSSMKDTCGCTMDGQPVTCSLAQACLNSGNCTRAQ